MTEIIIFFFITVILSFISNQFNFLPNFSGEKHQLFLKEKKIPLIGGILFLFLSINFFY